jgi:hypothetical protein
MKQKLYLFFTLLFLSHLSLSQIKTPDKRPFNIGIFSGVGGLNFTPIPGIDLHYKGTILRVAPGYHDNGIGIIREILPLSEVFYNWKWIASVYGAIGKEKDVYASLAGKSLTTTDVKGTVLTGAKVYFSKRWYSQLQLGLIYTKHNTPGYPSDDELGPYFEFSLGVNIFKNYTNEEDFE